MDKKKQTKKKRAIQIQILAQAYGIGVLWVWKMENLSLAKLPFLAIMSFCLCILSVFSYKVADEGDVF